jgi:ankyrin repeat protein
MTPLTLISQGMQEYVAIEHLAGRGDLSRLQTYVHARPPLSTLTGDDLVVYQQKLDLALTSAGHNGRVDCASFILDQGAHILATAASVAAMSGPNALAIYKAFVEHGWDVNERVLESFWFHSTSDRDPVLRFGYPVILLPVRGVLTPRCSQVVHDEAMLRWFLDQGADPTMPTDPSRSPLTTAATSGNQAVVDLLLSGGVKLEESNALHAAVFCKNSLSMIKFLVKKDANVNALKNQSNEVAFKRWPVRFGVGTALHDAAGKGLKDEVKLLLELGADWTVKCREGLTAAEEARLWGQTAQNECAELLEEWSKEH